MLVNLRQFILHIMLAILLLKEHVQLHLGAHGTPVGIVANKVVQRELRGRIIFRWHGSLGDLLYLTTLGRMPFFP